MNRIYLLTLIFLCLPGCGGRHNKFRSGIFDYADRSIAWYTNQHYIKYALSFPKADSVSDSLLTTKKNISLVQKIIVKGKVYEITSAGELKNGISQILINGKLFEKLNETYLVVNNDGIIHREANFPAQLKKTIINASHATPYPTPADPIFWLVLGFLAQGLFTSRMLVQWYSSEKAKKSVLPVLFWYLSVCGSILLLSYAIYRQDPVFILGQSAGLLVYFRNLWLIYKEKSSKNKAMVDIEQNSRH